MKKQMYKVFFNDRLIQICACENVKKNNFTVKLNEPVTKAIIEKWFAGFVQETNKKTIITHPEPELLFQIFRESFHELPAAGGIVESNNKLLFIFRNDKWDLPKGKIEPDENPGEAALREVTEECGITGQTIKKQLPSTYHIYYLSGRNNKGIWVFKETFWFEMTYNGSERIVPQKEEGITDAAWFKKNELGKIMNNTYENLKQIIQIYCI